MTDWYILKREQSLDFTKYFKNDCHWLWLFLSYHNNSESSVSINFSSGCHNTYISTMGNWSQFLANWIKFLGFCVEKKNQLDVTECFIALMIRSTCFGDFYAHHQELETICVLLPPMVCSAFLLVVGVRKRDSAASLFLNAHPAALHLAPDNQQPSTAHHRR